LGQINWHGVSYQRPQHTQLTQAIPLLQGGMGFLYFSPLFVQDRFDGLIAAVLGVDLLSRSISVPGEAPDFYLTLHENDQAVFSNLPAGSRELEEWRQSAMVTVKNSAWELFVIPSARALAVKNPPLPWLILGSVSFEAFGAHIPARESFRQDSANRWHNLAHRPLRCDVALVNRQSATRAALH
jgi:sensor domain CHASE-containing protein